MLRYAGGKSRAISILMPYIPAGDIVCPFLGGGALELELAKTRHVYAGDLNEPVANFWNQVLTNRHALVERLRELPVSKDTYNEFKKTLTEGDALSRAVKFYYVNRCCFSGCMTGGFSGSRFTPSSITKLERIATGDLSVECIDYEELLARHPDLPAYLDPPYDCPNLYLSEAFDHERLARVLKGRKNWVLSYNDTPRIRELYADCEITPVTWAYSMRRGCSELVIRPR